MQFINVMNVKVKRKQLKEKTHKKIHKKKEILKKDS